MEGDMLAWGQDRKERGKHARYGFYHSCGVRAPGTVVIHFVTVAEEEKSFPFVILGNIPLILGDVLEIGQPVAVMENNFKFLENARPVRFQLGNPRKLPGLEERAVAHCGISQDRLFKTLDDPQAERHAGAMLTLLWSGADAIFASIHGLPLLFALARSNFFSAAGGF
jgi:hypothetical protein